MQAIKNDELFINDELLMILVFCVSVCVLIRVQDLQTANLIKGED